ncbi:hypothetical protein D3C84_1283730 [compost metagenome]
MLRTALNLNEADCHTYEGKHRQMRCNVRSLQPYSTRKFYSEKRMHPCRLQQYP